MKTFKGTKGKWEIEVDNRSILNESGYLICRLAVQYGNSTNLVSEKEAKANAKLISSAPELLEALQTAYLRMNEILRFIENGAFENLILVQNKIKAEINNIEKAINKAL